MGFVQFIKYGFWGGISTGFNLLLFYWMTRVGVQYIAANVLSYFLAVVVSYFLNEKFVFQQKYKGKRAWKIIKYILIRGFSICADSGILFLCVTIWGKDMMLSKIFSSTVVILGTYFFNKYFRFKDDKVDTDK